MSAEERMMLALDLGRRTEAFLAEVRAGKAERAPWYDYVALFVGVAVTAFLLGLAVVAVGR